MADVNTSLGFLMTLMTWNDVVTLIINMAVCMTPKVECASMKRMMIIISDKLYARFTLGFTLKKDGGIMLYCRWVANIRGDGLSSKFGLSSSQGTRFQLGAWRQVGSPPLTIKGTISCDHVVPESRTGEFIWHISLIFDRCLILFRSTGTEVLYIHMFLVECSYCL